MLFLGGTINNNWRNALIPFLEDRKIEYYNPVVSKEEYNEEHEKKEKKALLDCDEHLFIITAEQQSYISLIEIFEVLYFTKIYNKVLYFAKIYKKKLKLNVVLVKENFNSELYYRIYRFLKECVGIDNILEQDLLIPAEIVNLLTDDKTRLTDDKTRLTDDKTRLIDEIDSGIFDIIMDFQNRISVLESSMRAVKLARKFDKLLK